VGYGLIPAFNCLDESAVLWQLTGPLAGRGSSAYSAPTGRVTSRCRKVDGDVLCQPDGSTMSADIVKHHVERATFCSHLAMRGAPARAIQGSRAIRNSPRRRGTCTWVLRRATVQFDCMMVPESPECWRRRS